LPTSHVAQTFRQIIRTSIQLSFISRHLLTYETSTQRQTTAKEIIVFKYSGLLNPFALLAAAALVVLFAVAGLWLNIGIGGFIIEQMPSANSAFTLGWSLMIVGLLYLYCPAR